MRHFPILTVFSLLVLLGGFSPSIQATESAIQVTNIAQVEIETIDQQGRKVIKRTPVVKAVPGTEIIYTTHFKNISTDTASNIVIDNPIPKDTEYAAGSAFGKNCGIMFSVDGGKQYAPAENLKRKDKDGKEQTALPKEYTHIRWTYMGQLMAGKSSEVGFRAVIK